MARVKRPHHMHSELKQAAIIERGVKNLRQFGYPYVNATNILTDLIYSQFFLGMLEDQENSGRGGDIDEAWQQLIEKIKANQKKRERKERDRGSD